MRFTPMTRRSSLTTRSTRRGSGGFTLLEVMLTVGILAVIMIPLMMWATQAMMRSNDSVSTDSVSFTQLSQYLKRDVPSATEVVFALPDRDIGTAYKNCGQITPQADPNASTGSAILTLVGSDGSQRARFEYVTVTSAGTTTMYRRVCHDTGTPDAPSWQLATWTEVATNLVQLSHGDYAEVNCADRQDDPAPAGSCGVVTMTVQAKNASPVELSQVRRTDGQPPRTTATKRPIARIVSDPNPAVGSRPFTVRFDGSTSEDPENPTGGLIYEWSVSPSAGASCSDPTLATFTCTFTPVYPDPDNPTTVYAVTLSVARPAYPLTGYPIDISRLARKNVEVRNTRPTASIGLSADPVYRNVPLQFFSNSADLDGPNGKPVEWAWDFNDDGQIDSTDENPTWTYPVSFLSAGQKQRDVTVRLTVRDSDGQTTEVQRTITVHNAPPIVAISPQDPTLVNFPGSITFSSNPINPCVLPVAGAEPTGSCDIDGSIVSYAWYVKDKWTDASAPGDWGIQFASGAGPVSHSFSGFDNNNNPIKTYTVALVATDDTGDQTVALSRVTINRRPVAVIAAKSVVSPATLFTSSADAMVVNGASVNGTTATTTASPTAVTFDALSPSGVQSLCPDPIPNPPTTSCDPDNSIAKFKWQWTDPPGQTAPPPTEGPASTTTRSFTVPGTYTLTLTVTDADGGTASTSMTVKVNKPPNALQATPNQPLSGAGITYPASQAAGTGQVWRRMPVNLTSSSTDEDAGLLPSITACTWSVIKSGTVVDTSSNCNWAWNPTVLGDVTLRLDVTDAQGGTARKDTTITVRNRPPIVNPSAISPSNLVYDPLTFKPIRFVAPNVNAAAQSTLTAGCNNSIDPDADASTPPMQCTWNWGDGSPNTTVGASSNVTHAYPPLDTLCAGIPLSGDPRIITCGTKDMSLTVTDGDGASAIWNGKVKVNRMPTATLAMVGPAVLSDPNYGNQYQFKVQATITDTDGYPAGITFYCDEQDANGNWLSASRPLSELLNRSQWNNPPPGSNPPAWTSNAGYPPLQPGVCEYSNRGKKRIIVVYFDNDLGEQTITTDTLPVGPAVNQKPIAKLKFTSPTTVDATGFPVLAIPNPPYNYNTAAVSFADNGSTDPDGTVVAWKWSWDQGVTPNSSFGTGAGPYTQAGFNNPGVKKLTLQVQDNDGLWSDPVSIQIRVNAPPSAQFTAGSPSGNCVRLPAPTTNPNGVCRNVPVVLNATVSTDADSPPVGGSRIASYQWSIQQDDGSVATFTTPTVTQTWNTIANRTITLTVTDTDGSKSVVYTKNLSVVDAPPKAILTTTPANPFVVFSPGTTLPVSFDGSASFDPDSIPGNSTTLRYSWDFGDGTTIAEGAQGVNTIVNHTYAAAGKFTASMTVKDISGTTTTVTKDVVLNLPPIAGIVPLPVGNSQTVAFDGSPSIDPQPDGDTASLTYAWNFGDPASGASNTATGKTPSHTFSTRGDFVVTLVVTDKYGTPSVPYQMSIHINQAPTAVIAGPPSIVLNTPYTATFDGSGSTDDGGAVNLTYDWDFGDGSAHATTATATHTFAAPTSNTTRTVTLKVTDVFGMSSTATVSVKLNRPPTAVIGPSTIVAERGFPTQFDGSGSTDPDGDSNAMTYAWDFGDGSPAGSGRMPTHTYAATGTVTVKLTVTDAEGGVSTQVTRVVTVTDRSPTASLTTDPDIDPVRGFVYVQRVGNEYLTVIADGSASTDPYGNGLLYQWDWSGTVIPFSNQAVVSRTFSGTDRITLTLTVKDPVTGMTATATRDIVFNAPPIAVISPTDVYRGSAPATVAFDGTGSSDPAPDNGPLTYAWNFGDPTSGAANTSTSATPSHTFNGTGSYVVTLTVTDKYGATGTTTTSVRVNTAPTAAIDGPPKIVLNPPYTHTFDGRGSTDDGGAVNLTFDWDFGDGTAHASSSNPSHTFDSSLAGTTRTVTLTVTDQFGETGTTTQLVKINKAPTAVIGPDPIRAKQGFTTQFDGQGSTDPDGNSANLTYAWNFGDPASGAANTSTTFYPVHVYAATGTYTVSLTVTDEDGLASATVTKDIQVTVNQAPIASIAPVPPPVYRNVPVTLDGSPSSDPDGIVLGWTWTFPGGIVQSGTTTTFTFTTAGPATASLVVTDDNGVQSAPATVNLNVVKKDSDGDGYEDAATGGDDCDDSRADVHPGADDPLDALREDTNCDNYDGVVSDTIFVRVGGSLVAGDPANGGCGSPLDPCGDLNDAVIKAQSLGRHVVEVASGDYGRVTISGHGVVIRGGYSQTFDRRGTSSSAPRLTRILGSRAFDNRSSAVQVSYLDGPVELRDLTIQGADAAGPGEPSYGLIAESLGAPLTVRDTVIIGGKGGAGSAGVAGASASQTAPTAGSAGQNSLKYGSFECNDARRSGGSAASSNSGDGGAGGQIDTKCQFPPNWTSTAGLSGANGSPTGGASCGFGGPGGSRSDSNDGGTGGNGNTGCAGSAGASGTGGTAANGTLIAGAWSQFAAANGTNGVVGSAGGGGAGGGGGGGTDNNCERVILWVCWDGHDSMGAGGGGGGAGGAAALTAGGGGRGGGASIAVLLVGSDPTFTNVTVQIGTGGAGGRGGNGGSGQPGGSGGAGGRGRCDEGSPVNGPCPQITEGAGGGAGGTGGTGGRGGASGAGGGGAGGPAFGVVRSGGATDPVGVTISGGSGGVGGAGGTPGTGGTAGANGANGTVTQRLQLP